MDNKSGMLAGGIVSTYLRYSLPWTFSMLMAGSAAIVDGLFIGRYSGSTALASINMVIPVLTMLGGLGVMLSAGGSAITGNYMGKGLRGEASAMLVKTMLAIVVISLAFCSLAWIFLDSLLDFLGASGDLRGFCADYLRALLPFCPFFPISLALSYFVRLDNRPVLASMGFVLAAAFNVILDAWLIAVLRLGLKGAALATGMSYGLSCLLFCWHFLSPKCGYIRPKHLGKLRELIPAAWNGLSEFVNETSAGIVIFLFNMKLMEYMGVAGVAAFTATGYVMMLGGMLSYGFADSLAPIISVNNGAREFGRMKAFLYCAAIVISGIGVAMTIAVWIWPELIARLFLPNDEAGRQIAVEFLEAVKWQFPFMGINMMLASYFTGRLWAASSFIVASCRSLVLPVLLVFMLPALAGMEAIYYVTVVTEIITLVAAIALFARGIRAK